MSSDDESGQTIRSISTRQAAQLLKIATIGCGEISVMNCQLTLR
jgi:hypothetical protein